MVLKSIMHINKEFVSLLETVFPQHDMALQSAACDFTSGNNDTIAELSSSSLLFPARSTRFNTIPSLRRQSSPKLTNLRAAACLLLLSSIVMQQKVVPWISCSIAPMLSWCAARCLSDWNTARTWTVLF